MTEVKLESSPMNSPHPPQLAETLPAHVIFRTT